MPMLFLSVLEPVATRKPKFSTESKITSYERVIDHDTTLLCPAQGFPVPTYRRIVFSCHVPILLFVSLGNLTIVEPVATKKPKFSSDAKFAGYDRVVDQDLTLLCPAQGFPVPTYRCLENKGNIRSRELKSQWQRRNQSFRATLNWPGTIESLTKISLSSVLPRGSQFQLIEPVATRKPKFSSDAKKSWYDRVVGQDLTLFCPAQGFPVPTYRYFYTKYLDREVEKRLLRHILVQPVGSKAPALTGNLKGGWMENKAGSSIVLTCPAQGYPVPSFRCIILLFPFSSHGFPVPTDEPVGGKAPALTGDIKMIMILEKKTDGSVVLTCPAQGFLIYYYGFPVPIGNLLEPVGSKAPTLTGGDVKGVWMEKGTNSSVVLQCPAQAYPVPSFRTCWRQSTSIDGQCSWRYDEQPSRLISRVVLSSSGLSQPVGSKAPTFTSELRGGWLKKRANSNTVLTCPAQGHPVPMFREKEKRTNVKAYLSSLEPIGTKAPALTGDLKGGWKDKRANSSIVLTCPAQGYPVPKPVGFKAPSLIDDSKRDWKEHSTMSSIILFCPAQGYPVPKPVGSKAPSILGEKGSLMERRTSTDIVIPCQGQGYPVPTFRRQNDERRFRSFARDTFERRHMGG
ncbi:Down syndrome cell adhesion molecule-like protein Dscam2 [Vespula maculifrons]|uniref:Down syndrome cell adhesion molecule-like protein Dscam2 n=1 Tax=Vespula maculifrons TaxID=7453 RepID=A0ABD2C8E1_VESMC